MANARKMFLDKLAVGDNKLAASQTSAITLQIVLAWLPNFAVKNLMVKEHL
jgi:hypothetical protein